VEFDRHGHKVRGTASTVRPGVAVKQVEKLAIAVMSHESVGVRKVTRRRSLATVAGVEGGHAAVKRLPLLVSQVSAEAGERVSDTDRGIKGRNIAVVDKVENGLKVRIALNKGATHALEVAIPMAINASHGAVKFLEADSGTSSHFHLPQLEDWFWKDSQTRTRYLPALSRSKACVRIP